jgi:hypothetical protein
MPIEEWRFLDARRALASVDGELQVWPVETLEPMQTLPLDCRGFRLSDDGRTLLANCGAEVRACRLRLDWATPC